MLVRVFTKLKTVIVTGRREIKVNSCRKNNDYYRKDDDYYRKDEQLTFDLMVEKFLARAIGLMSYGTASTFQVVLHGVSLKRLGKNVLLWPKWGIIHAQTSFSLMGW